MSGIDGSFGEQRHHSCPIRQAGERVVGGSPLARLGIEVRLDPQLQEFGPPGGVGHHVPDRHHSEDDASNRSDRFAGGDQSGRCPEPHRKCDQTAECVWPGVAGDAGTHGEQAGKGDPAELAEPSGVQIHPQREAEASSDGDVGEVRGNRDAVGVLDGGKPGNQERGGLDGHSHEQNDEPEHQETWWFGCGGDQHGPEGCGRTCANRPAPTTRSVEATAFCLHFFFEGSLFGGSFGWFSSHKRHIGIFVGSMKLGAKNGQFGLTVSRKPASLSSVSSAS